MLVDVYLHLYAAFQVLNELWCNGGNVMDLGIIEDRAESSLLYRL